MGDRGITADRIRGLFEYDPETGVFTSKQTGRSIGLIDRDGYLRWTVIVEGRGKTVLLHRLAWLFVHGEWPTKQIDHINGNPGDNRIANLRDVDQRENNENFSRANSRNKTGLLGVTVEVQGFGARICVRGKDVWLGTFETPEEAHAAYLAKKREVHTKAQAVFTGPADHLNASRHQMAGMKG